ncbi:helix-turn-helix transcriptional regulator [Marinifilum caeruleilacunae]|uniref:WYL domain-containing protein n=1 Tax=Marinifilum caeruleilacunae TaxID=2499076 RepID=A0ABX1WWU4_9BACT|nr:WYL domain-containing protein [Marinifilum caeruleilacunae]NOU60582.1 WYL domain-containing protein [Marinifilum caeruleilacunae]
MSQQATIKRYLLLIEKVKKGNYPSKQELIDLLNDQGLKCSERTFQRSLESIRNEFGVEIEYNTIRRGYFINDDISVDYEPFIRFLDIAQSANTLIETLSDGREALKYIHFDTSANMMGIHYLQPLLRAVKDNLQVRISYSHFEEKDEKTFVLNPELLKEYMNRWYVTGHVDYTDGVRIYALDRIKNIELLPETFERKMGSAEDVFGDIIGVNFSGEEVKRIVLSFTPWQGNYIRTLPMHPSQEVLIDNDEEFRIAIRVKPNFELWQRIQMYGDQVKVLEPADL